MFSNYKKYIFIILTVLTTGAGLMSVFSRGEVKVLENKQAEPEMKQSSRQEEQKQKKLEKFENLKTKKISKLAKIFSTVEFKKSQEIKSKYSAWDFERLGLSQGEVDYIESTFEGGEPAGIYHWRNGKAEVLQGSSPFGTGKGIGKIMYLSDQGTLDKIQKIRNSVPANNESKLEPKPYADPKYLKNYEVVSFKPGTRDDKNKIKEPDDIEYSVLGPDYDLKSKFADTDRLVSLGHDGEIILKVKNDGWILNKKGTDFIIFENPFVFSTMFEGSRIFQEFAVVSVAKENKLESYKKFPCEPEKHKETGLSPVSFCAGAMPTDQGGDAFDLSKIGVDKVRFIKITDTGNNFPADKPRKELEKKLNKKLENKSENTEGFDLDAIKINYLNWE